MDKKAIIVLEEKDIIEAIRIMTDNDKNGALNFMKKYVEQAIKQLEHGHFKSIFEWPGQKSVIPNKLKGGNHK
jgi:hypothetical protein